MRFGEVLLSSQNVQWSDKYLVYNLLKARLNLVVQEKVSLVEDLTAKGAGPGTESFCMPNHATYESYRSFLDLFNDNISTITAFFEERQKALKNDQDFYQFKIMHQHDFKTSLSSLMADPRHGDMDENNPLKGHLIESYIQSRLLHAYITMNLRGIQKLIKKHDKLTCGMPFLRDEFATKLSAGIFTDGEASIEAISKELVRLYAVGFEYNNEKNSAAYLETCYEKDKRAKPRDLPFSLAHKVDSFLLDCDGTLYRGGELLHGTVDLISWLKRENKKFLFLTNSSDKSPKELKQKFARMGVEVNESHFYTSALSTADFLSKQHPNGSAFIIGDGGLISALYDVGYTMNDVDPDYVVVGETSSNYNFERIMKCVNLVRKGAKLIGTNSDIVDKVETGYAPACGSLIAPIERATGQHAYYLGKPNPLMLRSALDRLGGKRASTVIIGDRMDTDIVSGIEMGISTVLVLSGVTTVDEIHKFSFRPDHVLGDVAELMEVIYASTPSNKDLFHLINRDIPRKEAKCS